VKFSRGEKFNEKLKVMKHSCLLFYEPPEYLLTYYLKLSDHSQFLLHFVYSICLSIAFESGVNVRNYGAIKINVLNYLLSY